MSKGFVNRKSGSIYYNPSNKNDTIVFNRLITLPQNKSKFDTVEERDKALEQFDNRFIINKPNKGLMALYIIHMSDGYYIKYCKNSQRPEGILGHIPPGVKNKNHEGYIHDCSISNSERLKLKPSDIFSDENPKTPTDIVESIKKSYIPEDIKQQWCAHLNGMINGKIVPMIDGYDNANAHEKYLGELSAPIALLKSLTDKDILDHKNYKIVFPLSVTNAMIDSYLISPAGKKIGISSKAKTGGGASASLSGILDILDEIKNKESIMEKYGDVIDIMQIIHRNNAVEGVLNIAIKYYLISHKEREIILDMHKNIKQGNSNNISDITKNLSKIMNFYVANTDNQKYDIVWHILAALAKMASDRLNISPVSDAIKEIFKHSNIIQIYAGMSKRKNDLTMNTFKTVLLSDFDGRVFIDSTKNFYGTGIQGKLNFKIKL